MATITSKRLIAHNFPESRTATGAVPGDDEFLNEFLNGDAEDSAEAFRNLVIRHGPMIMGVCRHVLQQDQDAEDAFQATFLTLARKADTIRDQRVLAGWLHEVAYRIAIRSRVNASRRRDQERQGASMSPVTTTPDHENQVAWTELRPVLHEEVNRLPEKYRVPIILSYLEGKSNEEVAAALGWPVGTVKGRLARARGLLRSRLSRRGLALSAAFIGMALSRNRALAESVPAELVDRTIDRILKAQGAAGSGDPGSADAGGWEPMSGRERVERFASLAFDGPGTHRIRTGFVVTFAVLALGYAVAALVSDHDRSRVRSSLGNFANLFTLGEPGPVRSCH